MSGAFPVGPEAREGGSFVATNVNLVRIVRFVYDLPEYRVVGGPDWARRDRFDIEARAGRRASAEEIKRMVLALLKGRFQLAIRPERREGVVYALVPARADKKPGPNLRPSAASCAAPAGPGETMEQRVTPNGGLWDSDLSYTGERRRNATPQAVAQDPSEAPALFTALQEQLGLKLERAQGSIEVYVIESAASRRRIDA